MKFPPHEASLHLDHNQHKAYYQTVEQYMEDSPDLYDWISEEEKAKAIETQDLWTLQWYPHTPIGFCAIAGHSLEAVLEYACNDGEPNG